MGQTDVSMAYADSQLDAEAANCSGLNKGECAQVRILAGEMPQGRNCTGNPETDMSNGACLTAAQLAALAAWVAAGTPP